MTMPATVVFGYDELLLASLEFLSGVRAPVSAVVFPASRQDWRANKVREIVKEKGLPILEQPSAKNSSDFISTLRQLSPALFLSWSYPIILSQEIIDIPKFGCVNVHFGLLPEYRGINGVRWALLNGENQTGITLHYMDAGIDSGRMIARAAFPITAEDDILSLMKKSRHAGLRLLENFWVPISTGTAATMPQDGSAANYFSASMEPSENIDWSKPNIQVHNLIRASVAPFPGAYTFWNGRRIIIKRSRIGSEPAAAGEPGTVLKLETEGPEIAAGSGSLLVTEMEIEGQTASAATLSQLGLKAGSKLSNS